MLLRYHVAHNDLRIKMLIANGANKKWLPQGRIVNLNYMLDANQSLFRARQNRAIFGVNENLSSKSVSIGHKINIDSVLMRLAGDVGFKIIFTGEF